MAFESFPKESVTAYEDAGLYYVNEKGTLRSPPGLGPRSNHTNDWAILGQSPPQIINGIFLSNRHRTVTIEKCDDGTTRNVYNPKKLFNISMMFVADNINLVESFAGFPEIVGEQLFNSAMELGKFENYHIAEIAIRLFYEAYGDTVLESLSLRDRHEVLTEHLDCIFIFSGLRALDLGGCGLGNDHEILAVIGNMYCLQDLCLSDNRLNNDSIQKMTTPLRLLGRGPKHLHALDLSGNPLITNSGAKYLTSFSKLLRLDLTGCSLSVQGICRLQSSNPSLRAADTDHEKSQFPIAIGNQGWAVQVIHSWLCASRKPKACKEPGMMRTKSKAQVFYGKVPVIPAPLFPNSNQKTNHPVIQLIADSPVCSIKPITQPAKRLKTCSLLTPCTENGRSSCEDASQSTNNAQQGLSRTTNRKSKFKMKSIKQKQAQNSKTDLQTAKRAELDKDKVADEEDDDLMASYLEARGKDSSSSQGSLWSAMNSKGW